MNRPDRPGHVRFAALISELLPVPARQIGENQGRFFFLFRRRPATDLWMAGSQRAQPRASRRGGL